MCTTEEAERTLLAVAVAKADGQATDAELQRAVDRLRGARRAAG